MLIWYKKQSAGQNQRGRPSSQVIWPGAPWCSATTVYSAFEKWRENIIFGVDNKTRWVQASWVITFRRFWLGDCILQKSS